MTYENPPVPHEVNVSRESVLAEFLRISAGLAIVIVVVGAFLYFAGGWLARLIPFSTEEGWVGERVIGIELLDDDDAGDAAEAVAIRKHLDALVQRLVPTMDLPADMHLHVHYATSDIPNAFATLGGHIVVTRGLYRRMPSENALALVVAHEIGHIKARDPISSVGGGATLGLLLVLAGGDANALAPQVASLVQLGYSRRAEARADAEAVAALKQVYGHAGGAAAVFEVLSDYTQQKVGISVPTLVSTHPADSDRIARLRSAADGWNGEPALVPLPVVVEE
jgi:Zn-dependent protease with chaperone function